MSEAMDLSDMEWEGERWQQVFQRESIACRELATRERRRQTSRREAAGRGDTHANGSETDDDQGQPRCNWTKSELDAGKFDSSITLKERIRELERRNLEYNEVAASHWSSRPEWREVIDVSKARQRRVSFADDDVVRRASVFVDTYDDAAIAGDIAQPLASGILTSADLLADLAELVAGVHPGRRDDDEVTLFKSAGTALEDLAAARLAVG